LKAATPTEKYLLYQGALNEGRSFETLIPAMKEIPCKLIICGEGNFSNQARALVKKYQLEDKVIFKGMLLPEELKTITRNAYMGLTLFDPQGLSNYYSLANRFFDYLHAGIPQICVDYPVYREINQSLPFALLIEDISSENISRTVNNLLNNELMYNELASNCIKARESFNWQQEEKILVEFYKMHL
jgi:glycosyltransferase involved in cell wall biosynthesis